ncbi:hypothetical protein Q5P01_019151 [Channa striata]|uniref:Uncharacterized protein n=1 Tax=Channa striata TaxID=64152 RepID=A0AA88S6K3_CHASR|nr:hypothetical protein Q5P01_019151 [Channa striata]
MASLAPPGLSEVTGPWTYRESPAESGSSSDTEVSVRKEIKVCSSEDLLRWRGNVRQTMRNVGRVQNKLSLHHISCETNQTIRPRPCLSRPQMHWLQCLVASVSPRVPVLGDKAAPRVIVLPQRSDTRLLAQLLAVRAGSPPQRRKVLR